ncbi:hypothetical protein NDU88_002945 [Pleurodeles waltl]|uniref:Uncharacterized protein n=1 Tax=Pleurodeles waltl TaxID=8319 RepID=A0AAV7SD49_PLEWA|nr:hypothetical protein NDU88_002945 [Pleurodeles waltl]
MGKGDTRQQKIHFERVKRIEEPGATPGATVCCQAGILRDIWRSIKRVEERHAEIDSPEETQDGELLYGKCSKLLEEFRSLAEWEVAYLGWYARAFRYGEGERPGRTLANLVRPTRHYTFITLGPQILRAFL